MNNDITQYLVYGIQTDMNYNVVTMAAMLYNTDNAWEGLKFHMKANSYSCMASIVILQQCVYTTSIVSKLII